MPHKLIRLARSNQAQRPKRYQRWPNKKSRRRGKKRSKRRITRIKLSPRPILWRLILPLRKKAKNEISQTFSRSLAGIMIRRVIIPSILLNSLRLKTSYSLDNFNVSDCK